MRSNCPAGRAARSMPARWSSPKDRPPGRRRWRRLTAPRRPTKSAKLASPARVAAFRTGLSAESRAAAFLMAKGYRILAKRFRTPYGEIDIVARKRNLIAFVEVKARASLDDAAYAVTPRQQAAHHRRRAGLADGASRACRIRAAFRRHADCAAASAAPSVSGIRRQHLTLTCPSPASHHNSRTPHETERRRPDGPHRAHQHPRRFDLRAAAGGAEARPRAVLLHARTSSRCAARSWSRRCSRSPCATRSAIISRSASRSATPLDAFDVILLRQDPPFDLAYITSTHLLERIHPKTLVVNDPASVRNAPEKLFVMDFPQLMPPTLISRDLDEINAFRDEHGAVVMKPLHGHGGAAVFRVHAAGHEFRLAVRHVLGDLPRALGDPALPSRGEARRQAHHPGRRRIRRRRQPRAGGRRSALQHGARRRRAGHRPHRRASARSARRSARSCASAACCSSASTSSTATSPRSTSPRRPASAPSRGSAGRMSRRRSGT